MHTSNSAVFVHALDPTWGQVFNERFIFPWPDAAVSEPNSPSQMEAKELCTKDPGDVQESEVAPVDPTGRLCVHGLSR